MHVTLPFTYIYFGNGIAVDLWACLLSLLNLQGAPALRRPLESRGPRPKNRKRPRRMYFHSSRPFVPVDNLRTRTTRTRSRTL
ncbi:hypothetical protein IB211_00811 [Intestinimonas butyriciproducens]|uniref:Uncharacterized protein n=1 Tax=Intestinimonas butyriciproducens TaxID=1297617 RepID=A0A0S2W1H1_9FIRM|nr:hypothetical protein IB211_00811 [Intestinimonas butyriciproducens]QBB66634.1 hypothetical protein SRB521_02375 [Intestinimonas butyriciproducens]